MPDLIGELNTVLHSLIGLKLSIAKNAGNMNCCTLAIPGGQIKGSWEGMLSISNAHGEWNMVAGSSPTEQYSVTGVTLDSCGGIQIQMTGDYKIIVFPCASRGEDWRLLEPGSDKPHYVVEAGTARVE